MENFWTSKKTINGLRHFVLLNETKEQGNITFLMVSVLDSEINLKTTYEELINISSISSPLLMDLYLTYSSVID